MKKWIPAVTLACSVAVGQIAAAEQRHDRNSGHVGLNDYGSQIHHISSQANSYDRILIGGHSRNVPDKGHHRRQQHRSRHDRHRHDSQCAHERRHYRRHHGDSHYDHGYSNHPRRRHYRHGQHERHYDSRPERRISRVIRAY